MENKELNTLVKSTIFKVHGSSPEIVETHISWVILTPDYAYKIKKPLSFSFLDFSTLAQRKFYCEQELFLNKRLAKEMYLKVIPIYSNGLDFSFQGTESEIIEFALLMKRMDSAMEMDKLLKNNAVSNESIKHLASKISAFHDNATRIYSVPDFSRLKEKFNDIKSVNKLISSYLGDSFLKVIERAVQVSDDFLIENEILLATRASDGYVRDVHGDFHSGNVFLYEDPVVFDCIEFNTELRQMDVINELAFMCLDLEAHNRTDLSLLLYTYYFEASPLNNNEDTSLLFNYYKSLSANVRAKVAILNAAELTDTTAFTKKINDAKRYVNLLDKYLVLSKETKGK